MGVEFTTSSVLTAAAINNMDIYSRVHVWGGTFAFVLDIPWVNSSLGEIGIIRIYSDVLTAAEVLQNYNYNKADYGLP